jgi:hypothetical protein
MLVLSQLRNAPREDTRVRVVEACHRRHRCDSRLFFPIEPTE